MSLHLLSPRPSHMLSSHAGPSSARASAAESLMEYLLSAETASQQQEMIADQLGWIDFSKRMEGFIKAIDTYTHTSKQTISQRATDHAARVRELEKEQRDVEVAIGEERDEEGKMLKTLEQERLALQDVSHSVQTLNVSLNKLQEKSKSLDQEIMRCRRDVGVVRSEKERQKKTLDDQKAKDLPELQKLENALGWKVEGVKHNTLLMRFTEIDPVDHEREFSLVLDVANDDYVVPRCNPPLPTLPEMLAKLNKDREFFGFIKRVRQAFRATVVQPQDTGIMFSNVASLGSRLAAPVTTSQTSTSTSPSEATAETVPPVTAAPMTPSASPPVPST